MLTVELYHSICYSLRWGNRFYCMCSTCKQTPPPLPPFLSFIKLANRRVEQVLPVSVGISGSGRGGQRVWEGEYSANIVYKCMQMYKCTNGDDKGERWSEWIQLYLIYCKSSFQSTMYPAQHNSKERYSIFVCDL
jgi:hypothetical protein